MTRYPSAIAIVAGMLYCFCQNGHGAPPVTTNPVSLDIAQVNVLAVSPSVVVERYRELEARKDLCPEIEIVCILARLEDMSLNSAWGGKAGPQAEEQKKAHEEAVRLAEQLHKIEEVRDVKVRVLEYLSRDILEAFHHEDRIVNVRTRALFEKAKMGLLSWEQTSTMIPWLFAAEPDASALSTNEVQPATCGASANLVIPRHLKNRLLQAIGQTQDPRTISEMVNHLPETPGKDAEALTYLRWLVREAFEVLGEDRRNKNAWDALARELTGRLVWNGAYVANQTAGGSSESREETGSFYKISWAAVYLDKDVWLANGGFCKELTSEEARKLTEFEAMDEDAQRTMAISVLRNRLKDALTKSNRMADRRTTGE